MTKKEELQLTEGSRYKIFSIGGKDHAFETEGVFRGFASIGIDEGGLIMELSESHGDLSGKLRIVPMHAILAIDILDEKPNQIKEEEKDTAHYYG